MKKLLVLSLAALAASALISCKKDNIAYGVDGKTPLPEAVDIGLVVNGKNIKWASFNLGASKEYEYGNYYAWGETETKSAYSWATYTLANGASNKLTAYCPEDRTDHWDSTVKPAGPDGELKLLPTNDAAHVHLGGKWRMPTWAEFQALLDLKNDTAHYECDFWTLALDENGNEIRDAQGNVIHGIRVTQKSTGNSVFLPAAGFREGSLLGFTGSVGDYWSSTLSTTSNPYCAWGLGFISDSIDGGRYERTAGFTIRPVSE